ncbi:MAG TPA: aspartate aminotransferase family protein [Rugosimonospora sp.]|nr:aspartate aminotransferase family protein [Rugosimonospora sp.]
MTAERQRDALRAEAPYLAPGASEETTAGQRVFDRGQGAILTDLDGNQYIDLAAGTLTQSVGHCHPEVVEALTRQAARLWNVHDSATTGRAELCRTLARMLPPYLHTLSFFSTGAEVVEAALRVVLASAAPGRNRVGALRHGFHGKTQGARMLVHWDIGNQALAGNSVLGYAPYCYRCPLDLTYPSCELRCAKLVRRHIAEKPNISALFFEPVLGAAGVIVPPPGYWELIQDACRANGVLLIADEVLTGGGRTGTFLASERFGIEPDLVTLAKGLGSGFPFAVLAGRSEPLAGAAAVAGSTASTYGGNPLGIAVAEATLRVVERDRLIDRVNALAGRLAERLHALRDKHSGLGDVRGLGLLYGLEFVTDRRTRAPAPDLARRVYRAALDGGVRVAFGGNVIRLAPPFNVPEEVLEEGLDRLDRAIGLAGREAGVS